MYYYGGSFGQAYPYGYNGGGYGFNGWWIAIALVVFLLFWCCFGRGHDRCCGRGL